MITNTNFLIPIATWCCRPLTFKTINYVDPIVKVWNIKGLRHQSAKIYGLEKEFAIIRQLLPVLKSYFLYFGGEDRKKDKTREEGGGMRTSKL